MKLAMTAEIRQILGVSAQRVRKLARDDPRFPAPVDTVAAGGIYREDAIREYAAVRRTKSGRPAKDLSG